MSPVPVAPVTDPAAAAAAAPTPDPAPDDATLSEFEQGVLREFAERGQDAGDAEGAGAGEAGSTQTPPGSQEGTDPPAGTETPPPAPEGSQAPGAPDATADAPPAPDTATGEEGAGAAGAGTEPEVYLGRPRADVEGALQTYDWLKALPPEVLQGIDAYISGAYVLVPRDQVPDPTPTGQAASPAAPPAPSPDEDEYLDPAVAKRLQAMQEELAALRQTTQAQVQQTQQTQYERLLQAVDEGTKTFAQERGLTEEEIRRVQEEATRLRTLQTAQEVYRNDPVKAVVHALDLAYLSDPSFQQREIDRRVQQQLADQDALAARKARAGAVTSAPGSVAKPSPTPPSKMTAEEKEKAMSEEIAAAMANR